jgi:hypothetical protein
MLPSDLRPEELSHPPCVCPFGGNGKESPDRPSGRSIDIGLVKVEIGLVSAESFVSAKGATTAACASSHF